MAENPKVNLALVNNIPDGSLEQGTIYMSPDVSGNFIKVAMTDSSTVTIFDGSAYATKQQVIDNEYIVATALNDLNNRIDNIDVELLTNITYDELKELRDTSALTPGMLYRITDYVTSLSSELTDASSAMHPFDIVVTADTSSVLNESAKAVVHDGDEYFVGQDLNAWELKYSLDNDSSAYTWADSSGKGVIYYMKDDKNNRCNYDFKNVMYEFTDSSASFIDAGTWYYTFSDTSDGTVKDFSLSLDPERECRDNILNSITEHTASLSHSVICSSSSYIVENEIGAIENMVIAYAFVGNKITFAYNSVIGGICRSNNIDLVQNTQIGANCQSNSVKQLINCVIGDTFTWNTVGIASNCTFGNNVQLNDIGDYFANSTMGNGCTANAIGPYCNCKFGNSCSDNTIEAQCFGIEFGHNCKFNFIGPGVNNVRMGNNCQENKFDSGKYIYFGNSDKQGADFVIGNHFVGTCQYLYFYNTDAASANNMLRNYHIYSICGTNSEYKVLNLDRNVSSPRFVLTRPGMTPTQADSTIIVDPAMLPERTKGGTAGQILVKDSGTDYDMSWRTLNIGSQIAYDSSNKVISLKDASGNILGTTIDATDFIKDGMVSDVSVYDSNLVISFNTDAGKEDISIPLSHIFDSSNYYTKSESDVKYVWDSSSPWEPGSGTRSAQLKGAGADASGNYSVAEGVGTKASGNYSHAEGDSAIASARVSHAEGETTKASGEGSHAEGLNTIASGNYSHAEGNNTKAFGSHSHVEGSWTISRGDYSHAEGYNTTTQGDYSHAEGYCTTASNAYEHAQGVFNVSHTDTLFSIGNGYDSQESSPVYRNALEIMQNGDAYLYGVASFDGQIIGSRKTLQYYLDTNLISEQEYDYIFNTSSTALNLQLLHLYIDDYPDEKLSEMMSDVEAETIDDFYDIVYDANINNGQYNSEAVYADEFIYVDTVTINDTSYYLWHCISNPDMAGHLYAIMRTDMTLEELDAMAKCNNPDSNVSPFVAIVTEDLEVLYDDTDPGNVNANYQLACYKIDEE